MVAKQVEEGDLFPRGSATNAQTRIKKRSGQVLFGPELKRPRESRQTDASAPPADAPVIQYGAALSFSRLSPGMTVLALVTKAHEFATEFLLPSGLRAKCVDDSLLEDDRLAKAGPAFRNSQPNQSDSEDGSSSDEEEPDSNVDDKMDEGDDDDDVIRPVWQRISIGQVLPVSIVDIEKNQNDRKVVTVSLKPHLVNLGLNPAHLLKKGFLAYAAVRSVEDHGYVLSFGSNIPHTAFLPFDQCDDATEDHPQLRPGSPVQVVTEADVPPPKKKRKAFSAAIRVSASRALVNATCVDVLESATFQDLRAGMSIRARVMKEGAGGMFLLAFGVFNIAVDAAHIPCAIDGSRSVSVDDQVVTRILYVDPAGKTIGASLLHCLVNDLKPRHLPSTWKTGTLLKTLKVEAVKPGHGITLRHVSTPDDETDGAEKDDGSSSDDEEDSGDANEVDTIPIFAHIGRVSDVKGILLEAKFHKDMIIKSGARIISTSRLDGIVNVDLRPSVLSRKALTIDEVMPGMLYDCKILNHTTFGALTVAVDGDPHLIGVVRGAQIADVAISSKLLAKNKSLQIGATVKCRVLSIDVTRGRIFLTARKSFIKPKYPVLTSMEEVALQLRKVNKDQDRDGLVFTGTVILITEKCNLLVQFCNRIVGLVPQAELCLDMKNGSYAFSKEEIETVYPIGQTVSVRVLNADTGRQKLFLSMNLQTIEKESSSSHIKPGDLFDATLMGVDMEARHFLASVTVKTPQAKSSTKDTATDANEESKRIECHLPFGHLSDVLAIADLLAAELGKRVKSQTRKSNSSDILIRSAMALHSRLEVPILTLKESLKHSAAKGELPSSYDEVRALVKPNEDAPSQKLRGYVKAILPHGVIVGFCGDAMGFVRKSRVADHFVRDPARVVKIDQSVSVVVESFDDEKKRFSVSLRHSDVGYSALEQDTLTSFGSFKKWRKLLDSPVVEKEFPIGSITKATVDSVHAYGVEFKLKSGKSKATGVVLNVEGVSPDLIEKGDRDANVSGTAEPIASEDTCVKPEASKTIGKKQNVRIIDVDPITGMVDLSDDKDLISSGMKETNLKPGSTYQARVLLVKGMYMILAVQLKKRTKIAFALGPVLADTLVTRPGAAVKCKVLDKSTTKTKRDLVVIDWDAFRGTNDSKPSKSRQGVIDEVYNESISVLRTTAMQDETAIIGLKVAGKVTKQFPTHAYVGIAPGIVGHLHLSKTAALDEKEISSLKLGALPADVARRFVLPKVGAVIKPVFVAGVRRVAEQVGSGLMIVELALRKEQSQAQPLEKGQRVLGFVKRLPTETGDEATENVDSKPRYIVSIGPSTAISCAPVDCLSLRKDGEKLTVGSPVLCLISNVVEGGQGLSYGCLSENGGNGKKFFQGIVAAVSPTLGLRVSIPWLARDNDSKVLSWGTVDICDIASNFDETAERVSKLKVGDFVRVRRVDGKNATTKDEDRQVALSMREEDVGGEDALIVSTNVKHLKEGSPVRGFVRAVGKKGCFVSIGRDIVAHVKLCDLDDEFVKDPEKKFPIGSLLSGVTGKISKVKGERKISMILRKRPRSKLTEKPDTSDLKEGSVVDGVVKRVERYGAMVELAKNVVGLLHKSEADQDRFIKDPHEEWVVGQKLRVVVIGIKSQKVRLGTQRCHFEAAGVQEDKVDEIFEKNEQGKSEIFNGKSPGDGHVIDIDDDGDNEEAITTMEVISGEENDDLMDVSGTDAPITEADGEDDGDSDDSENDDGNIEKVASLKVAHHFDFTEDVEKAKTVTEKKNEDEGEMSDDKEGDKEKSKRSSRDKREKKRLKEAAETDIRMREETLARDESSPETSEDYERLLMGEPNSCVLWIRYMAFCVQLSKMEKARAVAERALETIALEQETDRMNVWIAYINMEAQFGLLNGMNNESELDERAKVKRDAAVFRVFDRGCGRVTDVKEFHLQVANGLRKTHRHISEEILKRACRKFKGSSKVWIAVGQMRFISEDLRGARHVLDRALMSLEKAKHVDVISKFAQFEFKYGSVERGRTVFESLIGNFPKRVDLWNVYLDMQIGQCRVDGDGGDDGGQVELIEQTRLIFERFVGLELSSKKMKFGFKKWLDFEKCFGDKERQRDVKKRAREYVERNVDRNVEEAV